MKNQMDSEDLNCWFITLSFEQKKVIFSNFVQDEVVKTRRSYQQEYDTAETVNKIGRALAKEIYN